jgi:uncharacterized protein
MGTRHTKVIPLILALAASLAAAQEPSAPARSKAADRAAMIAGLERGKPVAARGERYQQLPGVIAVEGKRGAAPEQTVAALGVSAADVIENKGKLVLFRSTRKKAGFVEQVSGAPVYPTVLNTRTGTIGVLTGTLIVKPKNMADADAIAVSHGLEKTRAYPHLQTVFYKAKPGIDLADVSAALQGDPRIGAAYPEIIEHVRVPK